MKTLLIAILFASALYSAPAIDRKITFTQPDGKTFEGYLKGDAALHWIESEGEVIIFNPDDSVYYKAKIDEKEGKLIPSQERFTPAISKSSTFQKRSAEKKISKSIQEALRSLRKKVAAEGGPR